MPGVILLSGFAGSKLAEFEEQRRKKRSPERAVS
jgi:hypothetical protein